MLNKQLILCNRYKNTRIYLTLDKLVEMLLTFLRRNLAWRERSFEA